MAYDFGSQTLGIRNPFKIEGALIALRAVLLTGLGIYCLLQVSGLMQQKYAIEGWLNAAMGLLLLIWGLTSLGAGLLKMLRFYVGRNVPASLATNLRERDARHKLTYSANELHEMLMGRKNTTFREPQSLFSRLVHTLLPRLIFLPPTYRGLAENLLLGVSMTVFMLCTFALAWFAGATGLAALEGTSVLAWLSVLMSVYLLKLWFGMRNPFRHFSNGGMNISLFRISLIIALAILLPVAVAYVHHNLFPIPQLPINPVPYLLTLLAFAALACSLGLLMLLQRMGMVEPRTEVSEHRDNWQKSIVPRELFIRLDTHILANRRHQEIPNRVYQDFDPKMIEEGGKDKGSFKGRTLVETQPIIREMAHSSSFKTLRLLTSAIGQLMLGAAALWLVLLIDGLAHVEQRPEVLMQLLYPALLIVFGQFIARMGNAFWAELQFSSMLLDLSVEGTYTESKLSTGQSIYDSTRSENIVVRSTITPWFLLSNLLTSTFAQSGNLNLEQQRHILSLEKNDETLANILAELDEFFDSREAIAGINEVDLRSASQIYQMNEQTRAQVPSNAPALEVENTAGYLRQQEPTSE
jgi:hypothetical protein